MDQQVALDIARDTLFVVFIVSLPMLASALIVGVGISIIQAVTQVQEMTLTFIPKIVAVVLALIISMPFILTTLVDYTTRLFERMSMM